MLAPRWFNERASMASWAMAMSQFLSWSMSSVSMILWAIPTTGPYGSSLQRPSFWPNFHPRVSIWWLLLLLEPHPTEMLWAAMLWIAVWVRRLQPGRTFLLQLLDLHWGEKRSALHMNVPVSSVLGWELPSYSQCELMRSQKICT